MHLERTMDEIEKQLDYANSYLSDLRGEIEEQLQEASDQISTLQNMVEELEAEVEIKDTELQELMYENSMLQLELMEVAGQLIHMRHELDISRKGV
jgi:predicted nuclease with TOPRIM domain